MPCNPEILQTYLDGELPEEEAEVLKSHLNRCLDCRRELSHLRLLWLELGQSKEIEVEVPGELPFLRQQAIAQAKARREAAGGSGFGFWDTQKLAWRSALAGASYLPGQGTLGSVVRATGYGLPRLVWGGLTAGATLYRRRRKTR